MLALDNLGGLLYQEEFPTVLETANRIKAFREFRGDKKEWEAMFLEASSFSHKFFIYTQEGENQEGKKKDNNKPFKLGVFQRLKAFASRKQKQNEQDETLAMYLLVQFWLGWNKEILERAYYTYTDPQTRNLLVWFMKQEMQKASHLPFINKHEPARECGGEVFEKLKNISQSVAPH